MSLTNAQYDLLMRDYDRQRLENQRVAAERYAEVCAAVPAFAALDGDAAAVSLAAARRRLGLPEQPAGLSGSDAGFPKPEEAGFADGPSRPSEALEMRTGISGVDPSDRDEANRSALETSLASISRKRRNLLRAGGFPDDYLDPVYRCPDCRDTGYIDGERCHCLVQASIRLIYRQSHLNAVLDAENFDTFDLSLYSSTRTDPATGKTARQTAEEARRIALDFAEHFGERFENLLLYGPPGTGKTFLTHCIARALMDRCHSVVYISATQLEKLLFERSRDRVSAEYDNLLSCDLLIIDDLGAETVNSLTASALYDLLNERILRQRATLISTNKDTRELAEIYSNRIYSRLMGYYRMVHLNGEDIRIQKRLRQTENRRNSHAQ